MGVVPAKAGYLASLAAGARANGALLLADEVQLHMLEAMYQYPGTDAWKQAPASVWTKIAPTDVAQARGITMTNLEAITFIQRHGMDYIAT